MTEGEHVSRPDDLEAGLRLETSHGYRWVDLRERPFGVLGVGGVVFKPAMGQMYMSGGPDDDGRVEGVYGLLMGTAWTIATRAGTLVTVVRHDGQATQTVRIPDQRQVLAVVPGS